MFCSGPRSRVCDGTTCCLVICPCGELWDVSGLKVNDFITLIVPSGTSNSHNVRQLIFHPCLFYYNRQRFSLHYSALGCVLVYQLFSLWNRGYGIFLNDTHTDCKLRGLNPEPFCCQTPEPSLGYPDLDVLCNGHLFHMTPTFWCILIPQNNTIKRLRKPNANKPGLPCVFTAHRQHKLHNTSSISNR